MDSNPPSQTAELILSLLIKCYQDLLPTNLVQLARIPSVHKHQPFLNFLISKFPAQHLTASGFRLAPPPDTERVNSPTPLLT